jgi:hypothetical protein
VIVRLTVSELYLASMVGVRRHVTALSRGQADRNGADRMDASAAYYAHINGAQGECAAAKALLTFWLMSVDARKEEPDLLPDWQVRTRTQVGYDLIVRSDDRDDQRFVLVIGNGPTFDVCGWIWGRDAKDEQWLRDRGERGAPAFWVPRSALRPLGESLTVSDRG